MERKVLAIIYQFHFAFQLQAFVVASFFRFSIKATLTEERCFSFNDSFSSSQGVTIFHPQNTKSSSASSWWNFRFGKSLETKTMKVS
jgi:hypothetical protein